jgi:hypothetical protein
VKVKDLITRLESLDGNADVTFQCPECENLFIAIDTEILNEGRNVEIKTDYL